MKKAIALLTAVLMCMPVMTVITAFALDAKSDENREDIVILYTNDVHCGVNDYIGYDGLALYKKEMEKTHDNVLLVDAGDADALVHEEFQGGGCAQGLHQSAPLGAVFHAQFPDLLVQNCHDGNRWKNHRYSPNVCYNGCV